MERDFYPMDRHFRPMDFAKRPMHCKKTSLGRAVTLLKGEQSGLSALTLCHMAHSLSVRVTVGCAGIIVAGAQKKPGPPSRRMADPAEKVP